MFARLRQAPAYGAFADTEYVTCLGMGHIVEDQCKGIAQILGQPGHRGHQPIRPRGVFCDCGLPVDFPIAPTIGGAAMAGLFAATVMGCIDRYTVKPCRYLGLSPIALQLCRQGRTDVLCQIFCVMLGAHQPKAKPKQPVILAGDQAGKGLFVAILGRVGEIFVTDSHAHHNCKTDPARISLGKLCSFLPARFGNHDIENSDNTYDADFIEDSEVSVAFTKFTFFGADDHSSRHHVVKNQE